jgi:phage-related protein (TIGR01555 family)
MNWRQLFRWSRKEVAPVSVVPKGDGLRRAAAMASDGAPAPKTYKYPIQAYTPPAGVVPKGTESGIAMDSNFPNFVSAYMGGDFTGFPGYPHLSFLATRAEYRAMANALSKEMTREWIKINSSETAGSSTKDKVTELTKKIQDIGLQQVIQRAVEHDAYFGRAQILISIKGQQDKLELPLIISSKTISRDSFEKVTTVEAIWTTPATYNALDPSDPYFYKPPVWFMLGKKVHHTRLLTIISRPVPDILKPAYNFGGMSLSQLAELYVDNWLRTRQSVADLINNFSITVLATSMDQVLEGLDDGTNLFARAALFTATRSNKGMMLLDKDREELIQINTPLSGLSDLQAQSQEQMCSVSKTPSTILLGVAPTGFGNVSEGEITTWEKWVGSEQEVYRPTIQTIINVLQLSMYGEIDPDISFAFNPLSQMTPKELAEIRTADSTTAANYIDRGVIDPAEERERLARDPESGYQGLNLDIEITDPNLEEEDAA